MNVNIIKSKKSLKIITLLVTAAFIATASAQVYRYMYIEGTVTVGSAKLIWETGSVTSTIDGSTVSFTLNVEEQVPINFTDALYLTNTDAVNTYDYTISVTSALSGTDFTSGKIYIYEDVSGTWTYRGTIDLTDSASSYSDTLAASGADSGQLSCTIEINANQGVSSGSFNVQVEYEQTP